MVSSKLPPENYEKGATFLKAGDQGPPRPRWGPGAEPLVGGPGGKAPPTENDF